MFVCVCVREHEEGEGGKAVARTRWAALFTCVCAVPWERSRPRVSTLSTSVSASRLLSPVLVSSARTRVAAVLAPLSTSCGLPPPSLTSPRVRDAGAWVWEEGEEGEA